METYRLFCFNMLITFLFIIFPSNMETGMANRYADCEVIQTMINKKAYDLAKYKLAEETGTFMDSVYVSASVYPAKTGPGIDPEMLIELCDEYGIDLIFVLAQGQIESHFTATGKARKTLSPWNVKAYDHWSTGEIVRNGGSYKSPNDAIEPYLALLKNDYLVNGKTEEDLMRRFVNLNGHRYASNPRYEIMLYSAYRKILKTTELGTLYENYKDVKVYAA